MFSISATIILLNKVSGISEKNKCYINTLSSPSTIKLPLRFIIKVVKSSFYGSYQHCGMMDKTSKKFSTGPFSLGEI